MASTDAFWPPRKNVAWRVTFPVFDADGDLVTAMTTPDSEISKDGGTFADCSNEATEIATGSGMYFLDLTSTEMNADTVAIIVKSATAGMKTTAMVFYPNEAGDQRSNLYQILDTAVSTPATAGVLDVNLINFGGTAGTFSAGVPSVNVSQLASNSTAATILSRLYGAGSVTGTSDSGTTTSMVDAALTQADTDYWKGALIVFTSGNNAGQSRVITGFNAATDTVSWTEPLTQAAATQNYVIIPQGALGAVAERAALGLASANLDTQIATLATAAAIAALNNLSSAQVTAAVPTAAAITTAVLAGAVDGVTTLAQSLALANSALGGKLSGGGTGTETARDLADTKNRLVYSVDASGNRTAITRILT